MKLYELLTENVPFDQTDARSRLHADRVKANVDQEQPAAVFGLEDELGNITKVYVAYDQADDFEQALETLLNDKLENNDYSISDEEKTVTSGEVSEVIFELKDQFDILNVVFPNIVGDEEAEEDVTDELGGDEFSDDEFSDDEFSDDEFSDDTTEEPDVQSTLDKLIGAMSADAEAKKAEAEAREAEANAKTAEIAAREAETQVKKQEEVLDMETYNKKQADVKKESDLVAKLAKYRHDVENEGNQ